MRENPLKVPSLIDHPPSIIDVISRYGARRAFRWGFGRGRLR